jgi:hypothetical protein
VHLNVFRGDGVALNPESVFEIIPDDIAPAIRVLLVFVDGTTQWLQEGAKLAKPVKSFVVSGSDQKNLHEYVQAIPYIEVTQNGVLLAQLDMRLSLYDTNGFIDIRNVYPLETSVTAEAPLRQPDDFYPVKGTVFHQKLDVKNSQIGLPFQIKAMDMAGNASVVSGVL